MNKPPNWLYLLLTSMYIAGLIGLNLPATQGIFKSLTPFNLLFTGMVLVFYQWNKNHSFWLYAAATLLIGFMAEVIGVNTGLMFGDYSYGQTLGLKLWNVPLIVSINWFITSLTCGYVVYSLTNARLSHSPMLGFALNTVLSALLMTGLDYVIEPIAIRLDMWEWAAGTPPLSNYVGWFAVSLVLQGLYFGLNFKKTNPVALFIFVLQGLFFSLQWLI